MSIGKNKNKGFTLIELLTDLPTDPSGGTGTGCYGYRYYRYPAGGEGCDASKATGALNLIG